jgi:hypothetical protein
MDNSQPTDYAMCSQVISDLYAVLLAKETVNKLFASGLIDKFSADFALWSLEEEIAEYMGVLYTTNDIDSINDYGEILYSQAKQECIKRWKSAI